MKGIFDDNQPLFEKLTNGYHPMTEGVRWTEKYSEKIENIFSKLPKFFTSFLATLAIFILGTSLQGNFNDQALYRSTRNYFHEFELSKNKNKFRKIDPGIDLIFLKQ